MTTLILVEHDNQHIEPNTRALIKAAQAFQDAIVLLVVGYQCKAVAEEAACLPGVSDVWLADHECYAYQLAENIAPLIVSMGAEFDAVLTSASTFGKNILPRVAAKLDITQVSDVTRIIAKDTFEHPVYAGNAIETLKVLDAKKCLTIRTTAFEHVEGQQSTVAIKSIDSIFSTPQTIFIDHEKPVSMRPQLNNARVVVGGGRGFQDAERYKLLETFADKLGAAVAASRAAVDAGFAPNDHQVGQTGKVIAPDLYIAVGISGAVQHLAGIKDSKVIVAINKDEDAPIFQVANYGLVGDLFKILPELMAAL